MDDPLATLEAEYCPPLDPALLSAIVSDYNLEDGEALQNARAILNDLRKSALLEEAAGFDASGTGGQEEHAAEIASERATSCPERASSPSRSTEFTSISNELSSLGLSGDEDAGDIGNAEALERLDEDTKVLLLQELFGEHVNSYSIRHTLQKCNGKWNTAMEELLNHVYFGDTGDSDEGESVSAKSIDAFAEDGIARRGRKGKSKSKRFKAIDERRSSSVPNSPIDGSTSSPNKWQNAAEDIEFISSRTGLTPATVRSIYYENRTQLPQTINGVIKASMEESKHVVTDEESVFACARELGRDFPTVAPEYLTALIRLTHPSATAAHELAEALTAKPKDKSSGLQVIPRYAPVDIELLNGSSSWQTVAKKARSTTSPYSPVDDADAAALASSYQAARATAYAQASAAHRKAKSDRLMGGAAAYYGQVGREYAALSSHANAAAADALAAAQSSAYQLDLHGIDILNGVRIAQEKVERWYDSLGESRVNGRVGAGDRSIGYKIVVGLGRHSEGGKGKLGPAVSKMLRSEGWKIENVGAAILVKGRMKR